MLYPFIVVALVVLPAKGGVGGANHGAGATGGSGSATVSVGDHHGGGQGQPRQPPKVVKPPKQEAAPQAKPTSPPGVDSCTPWAYKPFPVTAPPSNLEVRPGTGSQKELFDSAGRRYLAYGQVCFGMAYEMWAPAKTGKELAADAFADATARAPKPVLASAPPTDRLIVNLETWFGVTPAAPVSATASIPGLSATVTLRPDTIKVVTGDGTVLNCALWGSTAAAKGGCAWTPKLPSVPKVTGGGYAFKGSVTLVWRVSWSATDGTGGVLNPIETTTPLNLAVREIQTVGGNG